jgi:RecJ-like exonuclease
MTDKQQKPCPECDGRGKSLLGTEDVSSHRWVPCKICKGTGKLPPMKALLLEMLQELDEVDPADLTAADVVMMNNILAHIHQLKLLPKGPQ